MPRSPKSEGSTSVALSAVPKKLNEFQRSGQRTSRSIRALNDFHKQLQNKCFANAVWKIKRCSDKRNKTKVATEWALLTADAQMEDVQADIGEGSRMNKTTQEWMSK